MFPSLKLVLELNLKQNAPGVDKHNGEASFRYCEIARDAGVLFSLVPHAFESFPLTVLDD